MYFLTPTLLLQGLQAQISRAQGGKDLGLKGGRGLGQQGVDGDCNGVQVTKKLATPPPPPWVPSTCISRISALPSGRGGYCFPPSPVPGSSERPPPSLGTLWPVSSALQAAGPLPSSALPKAAGANGLGKAPGGPGRRVGRKITWDPQRGPTLQAQPRNSRQPPPTAPLLSQQACR